MDSPYEVTFSIVNDPALGIIPPAGANLNGQMAPNGAPEPVTVMSNGGEAQVSVNAGNESGVLVIEASCISNSGRTIVTRKPNVLIHAGPPKYITPFMEGFDQGESVGAGFWRIETGALVRDKYNNPVSNNTPVWFYIEEIKDPFTGLPVPLGGASIIGFATVGNANAVEDTVDGTAFTSLTYPGNLINSVITISATSGNAIGTASAKLPMIGSQVLITTDPRTLHMGPASQPKTVDIIIYHTDGQGTPLKNSGFLVDGGLSQIIFNTNHLDPGDNLNNPMIPTQNYQDAPPIKNRVYTNERGYAYSRAKVYVASLEPPAQLGDPPQENLITITAWLMDDAQDEEIQIQFVVWMYDGNPPF